MNGSLNEQLCVCVYLVTVPLIVSVLAVCWDKSRCSALINDARETSRN